MKSLHPTPSTLHPTQFIAHRSSLVDWLRRWQRRPRRPSLIVHRSSLIVYSLCLFLAANAAQGDDLGAPFATFDHLPQPAANAFVISQRFHPADGLLYVWDGASIWRQDGVNVDGFTPIGTAPSASADAGPINFSQDGSQILVGNGAGGFVGGANNGLLFKLPVAGGGGSQVGTVLYHGDLIPVPAASALAGSGSMYFVDSGTDAFGTASVVSVFDAATSGNVAAIQNIPGATSSIAFDAANRLYVGVGYGSHAGEIRRFDLSSLDQAVSGNAPLPLDWSAGAVLNADHNNSGAGMFFDAHGNLFVGGGLGVTEFDQSGHSVLLNNNGYTAVTYNPANDQFLALGYGDNAGMYRAAAFGPHWNIDASGDWSNADNWGGLLPSGVGSMARFSDAITAPTTVTLDASHTVGGLVFDSALSYTIAGPGTLSISGIGGRATIDAVQGVHTIAAPLAFAAGNTVAFTGPGTLNIAGPQEHGADTTLTVNSGTLNMTTDAGAVGIEHLTINANASVNLAGMQHLAGLSIGPNAVVTFSRPAIFAERPALAVSSQAVLVTGSLSLSTTGDLDLKDNALVVHGGADPMGTFLAVEASIANAFDGGKMEGHGIKSSAIQDPTATGLGSALNSLLAATFAPLDSIDGQPLVLSDTIAKYTYMGDATLDGVVNDDDVSIIGGLYDNGQTAGRHWFEGDFTHDGLVNDDDVSILSGNYDPGGAPLSARLLRARYGARFASIFEGGLAPAAVPEPATLVLLAIGLVALLAGRRSRR